MADVYMGIDPGKTGGVAFISGGELHTFPMPILAGEVDAGRLASLIHEYRPTRAAVEKAQAMPKQGVTGVFSYGTGYGMIRGVLGALQVPYVLVGPRTWKAKVLYGTKKDKDAAIQYVSCRYPATSLLRTERCSKPHDGMADAACIAEHCRMEA